MKIAQLSKLGIPEFAISSFEKKGITELNPAQMKAVNQGLLGGRSMLVCTPTGSGKTAIATLAITKRLSEKQGSKAVYLVPLKALANEKFREYKELFSESGLKVAISTGDIDSGSEWLANYDVLILTIEKLDSLVRHFCSWLPFVRVIVIDEIHILNDAGRGPTLEVLITILRELVKDAQIIALSATIGNPERLAEWLGAELVVDDWRPVKLHKGVCFENEIEFDEKV